MTSIRALGGSGGQKAELCGSCNRGLSPSTGPQTGPAEAKARPFNLSLAIGYWLPLVVVDLGPEDSLHLTAVLRRSSQLPTLQQLGREGFIPEGDWVAPPEHIPAAVSAKHIHVLTLLLASRPSPAPGIDLTGRRKV